MAYGNMSQQKVVEEVVLRGLRPSFPAGTPLGYAQLAASCWHATAGARPPFAEVTARLQMGRQGKSVGGESRGRCSIRQRSVKQQQQPAAVSLDQKHGVDELMAWGHQQ
eukprot:GHUV01024548.1.p1 GENE.GHUV01024548.1~~GHUV01024548.1.p1  ORF type:complete len:109 (+),score=36.74 GHUV01024548.1:140-466(+)